VLGLAEGQELQYPTIAGTVAGALDYLNLDDVQRAGAIDFETDWLAVATYWTFDGLRVRVTTKEQDGKTYARFEAAYDPEGASPYAGPAAPEPAGDEPKGEAEDGGEAVAGEAGEDGEEQDAPEEVKAEAEKLQTRLAAWTYVIPQYSRTYFTKRLKDLLKPPAPPAPPADEESAAEDGEDKPYLIPDTLPPEIREQIREHQESLGHKVIVRPPDTPPDDGSQEADEASDDGASVDPDAPDDAGGDEGDAHPVGDPEPRGARLGA
jgi:hypothetical protein